MSLGLNDESSGLGMWGPKCAVPFHKLCGISFIIARLFKMTNLSYQDFSKFQNSASHVSRLSKMTHLFLSRIFRYGTEQRTFFLNVIPETPTISPASRISPARGCSACRPYSRGRRS